MPKQIGYVIGSLRKESNNRKLANALIRLGPPDFNFKELRIGDLPLYNQDDDKPRRRKCSGSRASCAPWTP